MPSISTEEDLDVEPTEPIDDFAPYVAALAALGIGRSTFRRLLEGRTPKRVGRGR